MKKKITAMIILFSLLLTAIPLQAFATGNDEDDLILETSGNTLIVKLELPNAKKEELSSVQLSLNLDAGAFSDFIFDESVTGKAKVYEIYYNQERKQVNLYIAGTKALFNGRSLTIGSVQVEANGSAASSAQVEGKAVKVVRGAVTEDLELSNMTEISLQNDGGSNPGTYNPGVYNPGQPVPGGQKPEEPKDPEIPDEDQQEPEAPEDHPEGETAVIAPRLLKIQNADAA